MKSIWSKIIINTILRNKKGNLKREHAYSNFEKAKGFVELKIVLFSLLKDGLLIMIGIASAAFGLESFLLPNNFIDGGATGIALLISEVTHISLSVLLILVNIPFILLGYNLLGKAFALKTIFAICGLAIGLATLHLPQITHDNTLVSVFGGFFLGMGIGFAVRGGAVLDGTEILAITLSKKFSTTIGDIIIIINIIVFAFAAIYLTIDSVLYSMVTYLTASKTLEFVLEGIEEYTGVTIVSAHSDEIRVAIIEKIGRGVTVYNGKRGYGVHGPTNNVDIIYTVITRLEISKLTAEIDKIDPNAFVVMNSIKDTKGGMIKKRRHKN